MMESVAYVCKACGRLANAPKGLERQPCRPITQGVLGFTHRLNFMRAFREVSKTLGVDEARALLEIVLKLKEAEADHDPPNTKPTERKAAAEPAPRRASHREGGRRLPHEHGPTPNAKCPKAKGYKITMRRKLQTAASGVRLRDWTRETESLQSSTLFGVSRTKRAWRQQRDEREPNTLPRHTILRHKVTARGHLCRMRVIAQAETTRSVFCQTQDPEAMIEDRAVDVMSNT